MNRGIYGAATGMLASQDWLDVVSNNLSNVNTTGYKRDGMMFQELMERNLFANGGGGENLGVLGSGPTAKSQFTVWEPGSVATTGNPLDVAILTNQGLFAVQAGDQVRYTRGGNFARDAQGFLVTKNGERVLDNERRPINLGPGGQPDIDPQGIVTVRQDDGSTEEVGRLGIFIGTFRKQSNSLYNSDNAILMPENEVNLRSEALEQSNVSAVEMMIDMITLSRTFELAQKAISTQDEQTGRLLDSLRGS